MNWKSHMIPENYRTTHQHLTTEPTRVTSSGSNFMGFFLTSNVECYCIWYSFVFTSHYYLSHLGTPLLLLYIFLYHHIDNFFSSMNIDTKFQFQTKYISFFLWKGWTWDFKTSCICLSKKAIIYIYIYNHKPNFESLYYQKRKQTN